MKREMIMGDMKLTKRRKKDSPAETVTTPTALAKKPTDDAIGPATMRSEEPTNGRAISAANGSNGHATNGRAHDYASTSNGQSVDDSERRRLIAEAAYFRAVRRNFANGTPEGDWLEAEAEVGAWLAHES